MFSVDTFSLRQVISEITFTGSQSRCEFFDLNQQGVGQVADKLQLRTRRLIVDPAQGLGSDPMAVLL